MDPSLLYAGHEAIDADVERMSKAFGTRGWIANLGALRVSRWPTLPADRKQATALRRVWTRRRCAGSCNVYTSIVQWLRPSALVSTSLLRSTASWQFSDVRSLALAAYVSGLSHSDSGVR